MTLSISSQAGVYNRKLEKGSRDIITYANLIAFNTDHGKDKWVWFI